MQLVIMKKKQLRAKADCYFLRVSPQEACRLAETLMTQVISGSCNSGRAEFHTEGGEYFTIGVSLPDETTAALEAEIAALKERLQFMKTYTMGTAYAMTPQRLQRFLKRNPPPPHNAAVDFAAVEALTTALPRKGRKHAKGRK